MSFTFALFIENFIKIVESFNFDFVISQNIEVNEAESWPWESVTKSAEEGRDVDKECTKYFAR